ncbi:lysozyme inhibitor LprI family protein [Paraferrimonas sp. SM1919]|uniref:lysozyme inhibitor LprI family protein n=1 Tax=Paraferrimonas sp. SM1919 TaxID=2662263 RepID=UPI0013D3D3DF|nr:lysozyme inhibitor LprI family protein [Paraferrimonas sp. SM1919]
MFESAEAASFDCAKRSTSVENLICYDDELGELDVKLSKIYRDIRNALPKHEAESFVSTQRDWLKVRNGLCTSVYSCMGSYSRRYIELKQILDRVLLKESIINAKTNDEVDYPLFYNYASKFFLDEKSSFFREKKPKHMILEVLPVITQLPEEIDKQDSIVIISSCRIHSCDEKSGMLIDLDTMESMAFVLHYIDEYGELSFSKFENERFSMDGIITFIYKDEAFLNKNREKALDYIKSKIEYNLRELTVKERLIKSKEYI